MTTETKCTSPATSNLTPLPRSFYLRPTLTVARELVGTLLVRDTGRGFLVGRIVELEAYTDRNDPASHSRRGQTKGNRIMFAEGGRLYVYFTYGMHFCANVVTETAGHGCAVLLRALEPVEGIPLMARRRMIAPERSRDLCSGPAKLTQAFGIGRGENGADLCTGPIWIARDDSGCPRGKITRSPRIGISAGRDKLWNFALSGSPFLSR